MEIKAVGDTVEQDTPTDGMTDAEKDALASIPGVMANRFYIGIVGNNFKVTFVDQEPDTKSIFPRSAVVLPVEGMLQLANAINQVLNRHQEMAQGVTRNKISEDIPEADADRDAA